MCGIAGKLTADGVPVSREWVRHALASLEHRGPDDSAFFAESPRRHHLGADLSDHPDGATTVLVHRRLSILDLSSAGRQPMTTDDGRHVLVFNGEIYNYLELRDELKALGCTFHTGTDTEVLLHAVLEWGTDALRRFVGMFAFALLDRVERTVLLARDYFGIKPLYYRADASGLSFASELPALFGEGVDARVNAARLYDYLCYGLTDHDEETLFAGVRQVPPAHFLHVRLDRPHEARPTRYWELSVERPLDISFDDAAARLRELFLDSVRLHLRSDVPVGAALSGGIDSSAIVMGMRHVAGDALDLHLFSYIADDPAVSEERWVDLVGHVARAKVHKVRAGADDLVRDLPSVSQSQGEPFASTSICMQHRVFRLAREHGIKVMLDGQGADEMLAGYKPYLAARLASLVSQGRLVDAARFLRDASQQPGAGKLWMLARTANFLIPRGLRSTARQLFRGDVAPAWLNLGWFRDHGVRPDALDAPGRGDVLREQLRRSVVSLSLPPLLRYEDRNSMASSIESRVPFLTPQLATFILSLPEEHLIAADGTSKAVFRAAMRGIVPDEILDRKDKIGFATPQKSWLSTLRPWVDGMLSETSGIALPALNFDRAEKQWTQMLAGKRSFDGAAWRWLNTIDWTRRFDVRYA